MNGFVKISREIINTVIFSSAELLQLFIYCLIKASYETKEIFFNGSKLIIQKGSFVTGIYKIADDLKANPNTIYARLRKLQKLEFITIESNNQYSIITLINYETNENYIKLYRKILLNKIFYKSELLRLFIFLIIKASFTNDYETQVESGCLITNRIELAEKLNQKPSTVYKRLNILKNRGYITMETTNKYTIIKIINFNKYQSTLEQKSLIKKGNEREIKGKIKKSNNKICYYLFENSELTQESLKNDNNEVTTKEQQNNTTKNVKNVKNKKRNIFISYPAKLLNVITGKKINECYGIVNNIIKDKNSETSLTDLQKILMLMYIIKQNQSKALDKKFIGIIRNKYRDLNYSDFNNSVFGNQNIIKITYPDELVRIA